MTTSRYLGLFGALFVGSLVGSFLAGHRPNVAQAQTRVQNQDYLLVPAGGLRLVTEQGRPLGVIGNRNGNGALILFDAGGQPSITLSAGPSGRVSLSGADAGANVLIAAAGNSRSINLTATAGQGTIMFTRQTGNGSSIVDDPNGGRLNLVSRNGSRAIELLYNNTGGQLNLGNQAGTTLLQLLVNETGGRIDLKGNPETQSLSLRGKGEVIAQNGENVSWRLPKEN